jgi:hypothetical protein
MNEKAKKTDPNHSDSKDNVLMSDTLTAEIRKTVVENTARLLKDNYIFPEIAEKMAGHIQERFEHGFYDSITDVSEFCRIMTADLQDVSQDLHLSIYYNTEEAAEITKHEHQKDTDQSPWWTQVNIDNYGIKKVEYLTGNIGYIDIQCFAPVSLGGKTAAAAMNFLANSDAVIFDLRQNGGGDQYMVQLIESYLFGDKPSHLITIYERPADTHRQIWTLSHVPGKRLPDIPVYVLTSGYTFSGGEDFSYTLKHHGRAIIVGEPTGGGGHGIDFKVIHTGFLISLPTERPIHPVTKSNWEGTGVEPHILVPREDALKTAHIHALRSLIKRSQDTQARSEIRRLEWELEKVQAIYARLRIDENILSRYVGRYGNWIVTLENGALFMSSEKRKYGWKLIPITETLFIVDELYNVRFVTEHGTSALVWTHRDNDQKIKIPRTEES